MHLNSREFTYCNFFIKLRLLIDIVVNWEDLGPSNSEYNNLMERTL